MASARKWWRLLRLARFPFIIPRVKGHCGRLPDEAAEVEGLDL